MALDVARLGILVDSLQVKRGADDLERFRKSGASAEQQTKKLGSAAAKSGKQFSSGSHSLRMFSLQMGQVTQQGAVTGNYLNALAIQLPDILIGFGTLGAVAGVAAGAMAPLISNIIQLESASDALKDALADLDSAMSTLSKANRAASAPIGELLGQYGGAADQAKRVLEIQRKLAELRATSAFNVASSASTDSLGGELFANFTKEQIEKVGQLMDAERQLYDARKLEFEALKEQGRARTAEGTQRMRELRLLMGESRGLALANEDIVRSLQELENQLNVTPQAAAELAAAFIDVENALDPEAKALGMAALAERIWEATDGLKNADESTRDFYEALVTAADRGLELSVIDYRSNLDVAAIEAREFSQELWNAVSAANKLSGRSVLGGRGGDPRDFEDDPYWRDKFFPKPERPKANTKGRGGSSRKVVSEAEREARAFLRAGLTVERYNEVLQKLNDMHETGEISTAQYTAAVDKLDDRYSDVIGSANEFEEINGMLKESILDMAADGVSSLDDLARAIKRAAFEALLFGEGPLSGGFAGGGGSTFGGLLGGLLSFDGGGDTGSGPRSGGLDGKGGFLAMLHPQETVIDHTKQSAGGAEKALRVTVEVIENGMLRALVRDEAGAVVAESVPAAIAANNKHLYQGPRR